MRPCNALQLNLYRRVLTSGTLAIRLYVFCMAVVGGGAAMVDGKLL